MYMDSMEYEGNTLIGGLWKLQESYWCASLFVAQQYE